jgi:uncharacterized protein
LPAAVRAFPGIEGASHHDLYDKEQYVGPTIAKLTEFFAVNLADRALV